MAGNICPQCGKAVMTYARFFREAEPYKISKCGNCGSDLRRSKSVYWLLLFMCLFLIASMLGVFWMFNTNGLSKIAAGIVGVIVFVAGILLTNYLGFAFVGWIPAEDK